ncbi:meprin A subunit beta-like [Pholidichthys leucotaenia]
MRGYMFLIMSLLISPAISKKQSGPKIVAIGEDHDIPEINNGHHGDDILLPLKKQRSSIIDRSILWTSPVSYVLDKGLEMNAKGVTLRAFDQFRLKSCIDFKPRDSEDYYISVQKLDGCYSYIGKVIPNGQELSIGTYCDEISTVEHEFLHAFGFFHEQSRFDRDKHVRIIFDNVIEGFKSNFEKVSSEYSSTNEVPYDYWSVMHYGKNAFTNGNGSTIITTDPAFQDVIGQRLEMSPSDVLELNRLYKCNSAIAFKMYCGFSSISMCQMNRCSQSNNSWEMVTQVVGGPNSDHTSLNNGDGHHGENVGYFMHASTASGQEGDLAWLETKRVSPNRDCHVQCLQFYYYHSGNESDELNIWLREFEDENDSKGTVRLMGQIAGPPTYYWKLHHVLLNATKLFQVEFEVRKGAGVSWGGFSVDDINLSETECPHLTQQINDFEKVLNSSAFGTIMYSPQQYSREGYGYRFGLQLLNSYFGIYVQLVSGDNDNQLEWPCPHRQVTFQLVDQNPNIQMQMSKQRSLTTDPTLISADGTAFWDNPRETGTETVDENNEKIYVGTLFGRNNFATLEEMRSRNFLKGNSAIFVFSFQDLTHLVNGSSLPCPEVGSEKIIHPPTEQDKGPCSSRITPTTMPPPKTTDESTSGFSPAMVASPILTLLSALMLLIP